MRIPCARLIILWMSAPVPVCTAARSWLRAVWQDICKVKRSITGAYLSGRKVCGSA